MNDDKIRISMDDLTNVSPRSSAPSTPPVSSWSSTAPNPYVQNQYVEPQKSSVVPLVIGIALILLVIVGGFGCLIVFHGKGQGSNPQIQTSLNQPSYKEPITELLERDEQLASQIVSLDGLENAQDKDLFLNRAGNSLLSYVRQARAFDDSSVPHDFAVVYRNFLSACEERGHLLVEHPHIGNSFSQFLDGFLMGFSGNISEAFAKDAQMKAWAESVDATQPEILACRQQVIISARKYGVNLDQDGLE